MTDTYISDEMVEAAATHLEIDFDGDEPFIRLDSINAALEAIAPALVREGMKRAAEVADEIRANSHEENQTADGEHRTATYHIAKGARYIAAAIRTAAEDV